MIILIQIALFIYLFMDRSCPENMSHKGWIKKKFGFYNFFIISEKSTKICLLIDCFCLYCIDGVVIAAQCTATF